MVEFFKVLFTYFGSSMSHILKMVGGMYLSHYCSGALPAGSLLFNCCGETRPLLWALALTCGGKHGRQLQDCCCGLQHQVSHCPPALVSPSLDIAALATVYPALCIPVQTTALTPGFWHGRRRLWLSRPIEKLLFQHMLYFVLIRCTIIMHVQLRDGEAC